MKSENRVGLYSSISASVLAVITFAIAIFTPPLSGPLCRSSCFQYPFTEIASRFPRDYLWMYPAIILTLIYLILMISLHYRSPQEKKIFSHIALSLAIFSAAVLISDYFLQVSIIQPSLINGETDGIAILTQFNSHGVFIALEELGYILMSLSFLFIAFTFSKNKLEKAVRWTLLANFILTFLSFLVFSAIYGINREYLFEVAAISINWITLIVSGILLTLIFRRENAPQVNHP